MRIFLIAGSIALAGLLLNFGFQNCSQVNFTAPSDDNTTVAGSDNPTDGNPPGGNPPDGNPPGGNPDSPTNCPSGTVFDGTACVTPQEGCLSYQVLQPDANGNVTVPQRTSAQICHVLRVFTHRTQFNSLSQRTDIIAANHNGPKVNDFYTQKANPYVLSNLAINLTLQGPREVFLSGSANQAADLFVDNFFLLELETSPKTLWIRGTRDIFPRASVNVPYEPIQIGSRSVAQSSSEFFGTEQGSTETVKYSDLTNLFPVGQTLPVRVSALDCGGNKKVSDGFLLFR